MTPSEILIFIAFFCAAILGLIALVAYRDFECFKKTEVEG